MAHGLNDTVLLNSGSQLLLNDGESVVLLNTQTGVFTEGVHATPALVTKPRRRQKISVEFAFIIKAAILTDSIVEPKFTGFLVLETITHYKIKSILLTETSYHHHFRASLVKDMPELKYRLIKEGNKFEYKLESYSTVKTIKKLLLKKMKEMLGNG